MVKVETPPLPLGRPQPLLHCWQNFRSDVHLYIHVCVCVCVCVLIHVCVWGGGGRGGLCVGTWVSGSGIRSDLTGLWLQDRCRTVRKISLCAE